MYMHKLVCNIIFIYAIDSMYDYHSYFRYINSCWKASLATKLSDTDSFVTVQTHFVKAHAYKTLVYFGSRLCFHA